MHDRSVRRGVLQRPRIEPETVLQSNVHHAVEILGVHRKMHSWRRQPEAAIGRSGQAAHTIHAPSGVMTDHDRACLSASLRESQAARRERASETGSFEAGSQPVARWIFAKVLRPIIGKGVASCGKRLLNGLPAGAVKRRGMRMSRGTSEASCAPRRGAALVGGADPERRTGPIAPTVPERPPTLPSWPPPQPPACAT